MEAVDLREGKGWKPVVVGIRFSEDEKILINFRIFAWGGFYQVATDAVTFADGRDADGILDPEHIEAARDAVYDHIADAIAELVIDDESEPFQPN
jgi:hypothetical protein